MKVQYEAYEKSGHGSSGVLEVNSIAEAEETLRRKGLYVTKVQPARAGGAGSADVDGGGGHEGMAGLGGTRRLKNLAVFARQLYVLVASGTPLVDAIGALERQTEDQKFRQVLREIRMEVEQGSTLHEAMEPYPQYFDASVRSMIAAGETGGNIQPMLDRLGSLTQKRLQARSAVIGALVYPSLLIVLAGGVMAILLTFVIPRFADLFDMLGVPLPGSTKALIMVSDAVRNYWWMVLGGLAGAVVLIKLYLASSHGRWMVDTVAIRFPQIGTVHRNFITARIVRLLGVLLESRVPMIEALQLTRKGTNNLHYARLLRQAEDAVVRGEPVSSAFADPKLIKPSVHQAVRSGEQSGQVGALLLILAEFLDEENEVVLRSLTSIIEPIILVFLGLLVGAVAMSMFTPLFDLTAMTQGGG